MATTSPAFVIDLDFEQAKLLASSSNPHDRLRVAQRSDIPPELLFFLAADTAAEVRKQIAANPATPGSANLILARDDDQEVRGVLARKATAMVPRNGGPDPGPLERFTLKILSTLSTDPSPAVRVIMAEALKDLEHAPYMVVKTLAHDREIAVAQPVLHNSPQLTDNDLLEIVGKDPIPGALSAIATRRNVSAKVADAIVRADDVEAVTALLGNHSAQIREETLDLILDRAPAHEGWHEPLVNRPQLSGNAARRLAQFIAVSLVDVLQQRADLDRSTAEAVTDTLRERLKQSTARAMAPADPEARRKAAVARARMLHAGGHLGEAELEEAVLAGERDFTVAGLALRAGLAESVADRILRSQSARGVVALVWKAGLRMPFAVKLQLRTARLPAKSVLQPGPGDQFPMTAQEMLWQLRFFGGG